MRILFVTPYVPSRLRPRPLHFIHGLAAAGHRVNALAVATDETERRDLDELRHNCESVRILHIPRWRSVANSARGLATRAPLQAWYCRSPRFEAEVGAALTDRNFDVLHFEHLRTAFAALRTRAVASVFDAVDCLSLLHEEALRRGADLGTRVTARLELARTRRFERRLLEHFPRVFVASQRDRESLLAIAPSAALGDRVRLLANGVDAEYFRRDRTAPPQSHVVFVGRLGYHANRAAAQHLLREIMPLLWRRQPDARLTLVGADPAASLRRAAATCGERVTVTGYVDDIRPYLAAATVAVAPLPYSVGIQNKVLEAMAMGVPVVASPAAVAALQASSGTDLLVADDSAEFAAAVAALVADPVRAGRIGAAGRRYVERHHSWPTATRLLEEAYREQIEARRG